MTAVASASKLSSALTDTSGTVTNFLEELVGERIAAERCHHVRIGAPAANDLGVDEGEPLLCRAAVLQGCVSGNPYVYAESLIVVSRLPAGFLHRLETSSDPIGRLLDETGTAVTRKHLLGGQGPAIGRWSNFDEITRGHVLDRAYRIDFRHRALMIVTEWFLRTLGPFLH